MKRLWMISPVLLVLSAKGVAFLGPPLNKPFPHVYFKDSDGNTFFLSSR